ncbi:serine protease [Amycolatopsis azurea DSM 43854]|uniref:Serine protease n=2 Tax=Amycolatopsis azurea TaxID=36819 RepID=M2PLT5_9PSEU|nr:S8 family peptidase [Amycolatopsis azurea]EMD25473.1 putative secreted serine protease [Amycolatopsis azurea DSM 43854]OOC00702.1 serine protease [Amycolatopsis azurea DSM 43854]
MAALALLVFAAQPASATEVQQNPPNWGLDRIDQRTGLDQLYHYDTDAKDVTVYVIDSGVDAAHPDFGGRVKPGKDFLNGGTDTSDTNGHGTYLAGVAASKSYGVAKGAQIVPIRVIDAQGGGATDKIIAGIDWVTQNAHQPAVAVLGIGGTANDQLDAAVRALAAVVPVALPAGGEATDAGRFSPGRVTEALTVGSTDASDQVGSTSNYGEVVDMFAPGVDVPGPNAGGSGGRVLSGTSSAAAHVAGVAALYRALHPDVAAPDVTKALVDLAAVDVLTGVHQGTANRLLQTPGTQLRRG